MLEQVSVSIFGVDVWMNAARENEGFLVASRGRPRGGDTNDKHKAGTFDFR